MLVHLNSIILAAHFKIIYFFLLWNTMIIVSYALMKNPKFKEISDMIIHDTSERLNGQKKSKIIHLLVIN